jgi:hypothetical protein
MTPGTVAEMQRFFLCKRVTFRRKRVTFERKRVTFRRKRVTFERKRVTFLRKKRGLCARVKQITNNK